MAYADQKRNPTVAIGSVVLVHVGLGAALLSGLVVKFAPPIDKTFEATNVEIAPPPDPVETPPPPRDEIVVPRTTTPPIQAPIPEVPTPTRVDLTTTTLPIPPVPGPGPIRIEPPTPPVPPTPSVNLSRGLRPSGDQGRWFPQDSYPPAARRAGAEGRVSVSVDVGTDGRVIACRVTSSSGNDDLDKATCRLATRNGRFEPARDASGAPTSSTAALRNVRWTLE
ncbi:energy transducer TonB [uncultured Sphingomonas sp.]|uniref:energy transducer TonB n=1 Tax=uncultured Sphingomonas sp. TaxID=158754 RepID=UPI0035CC9ADA